MCRAVLVLLLLVLSFSGRTQFPIQGTGVAALADMRTSSVDVAGMSGNPALISLESNAFGVGFANRYGIREWSSMNWGILLCKSKRGIGLGGSYLNIGAWNQYAFRLFSAISWESNSIGIGTGLRRWRAADETDLRYLVSLGAALTASEFWRHLILIQLELGHSLFPSLGSTLSYSSIYRIDNAVELLSELGLEGKVGKVRIALRLDRSPWLLSLGTSLNEHPIALGLEWSGNQIRVRTALQWHAALDASPSVSGNYAF